MPTATAHDVVLYGASGFVGRLTAAHLAAHAPADARIALAGRSIGRLREVRDGLGEAAAAWPLLIAEADDPVALAAMVDGAGVVVSTVGPYARYGAPLVGVCAAAGVHYADLTGEVLFVRGIIDRFHAAADRSGARIVTSCGYDSIPSDLGVLLVARHAADADAGTLTEAVLKASAKGGVSGGTIDSMRAQMETVSADPATKRVVADPYALSPDRPAEADLGPQADAFLPRRDQLLGEWTAPFVMASYNTRVVRRSNALSGWSYGRRLAYREVMGFGSSPLGAATAAAVTGGLAGLSVGMGSSTARRVLDRFLPKPGAGPSASTMDGGHFRSDLVAVAEDGRRFSAVVSAAGDPGYKATAVMLGESALALAFDGDRLPDGSGVLTPATGIGDRLIERLRARSFLLAAGPATR